MSSRNREENCSAPGKDRHSFESFTSAIGKSDYEFLSCYVIFQSYECHYARTEVAVAMAIIKGKIRPLFFFHFVTA